MTRFRLAVSLGSIALTAAAVLGSVVTASAGSGLPDRGILPPGNPVRDIGPSPNFLSAGACVGGRDSTACNAIVVHAVDHARQVLEKLGGLSFSLAAYEQLTPDEQLFVTANLERVQRGRPAIAVLTKSLDAVAQDGANSDTDPPFGQVPATLPGGGHWVSLAANWAGGFENALGADYGWMYDDKGSAWGHRDNILGGYGSAAACHGTGHTIAMGAGHVTKSKAYGDSESELLAGICGPAPTDVVLTWAKAKKRLHIA